MVVSNTSCLLSFLFGWQLLPFKDFLLTNSFSHLHQLTSPIISFARVPKPKVALDRVGQSGDGDEASGRLRNVLTNQKTPVCCCAMLTNSQIPMKGMKWTLMNK